MGFPFFRERTRSPSRETRYAVCVCEGWRVHVPGPAVRLTSAGTGVQMPKAPPKAKKAPKNPKPAPPVPEHVLKKRKKQESAAAEKAKQLVAQKAASKVERRTILNKAKTYAKEYADTAKDLVDKRREAKKHGNFYMEPEPKLMLVVRIRGINAVDPKTRKILQLMRLRKVGVPLAYAARLPPPHAVCTHQIRTCARVHASGVGPGGPPRRADRAQVQAQGLLECWRRGRTAAQFGGVRKMVGHRWNQAQHCTFAWREGAVRFR